MKIGIIGGGVVGRATARCFMEHAEVKVYDIVPERSTHTLADALDADIIFVTLPRRHWESIAGHDEHSSSTCFLKWQAQAVPFGGEDKHVA